MGVASSYSSAPGFLSIFCAVLRFSDLPSAPVQILWKKSLLDEWIPPSISLEKPTSHEFQLKFEVEFTGQAVKFFFLCIAKRKLIYYAKLNVLCPCEPCQCANNGNPLKVSCQDQNMEILRKRFERKILSFNEYLGFACYHKTWQNVASTINNWKAQRKGKLQAFRY